MSDKEYEKGHAEVSNAATMLENLEDLERRNLRDQFAMAVLTGSLSAAPNWAKINNNAGVTAYDMAKFCYEQADAMLAQRNKK